MPKLIVCDNLKAGVTAACRYEPGINRTYQDMAAHYGTAILPARVRRPRDKAKVEVGVLIVERCILARLRNRRFFSLERAERRRSANCSMNSTPGSCASSAPAAGHSSRRSTGRRCSRCRPSPTSTPNGRSAGSRRTTTSRSTATCTPCRIALIREVLEARITDTTVEVFHRGKRVASHARSALRNRHTTIAEHMPSAHRRYAEWTPARIAREAARIGPATAGLCDAIMRAKPHPEQGFRACLGILRLAKSYGGERLEAACQRGLDIGARPTARSPRSCRTASTGPIATRAPPSPLRSDHAQHPRRRLLPLTKGEHDAQPSHP